MLRLCTRNFNDFKNENMTDNELKEHCLQKAGIDLGRYSYNELNLVKDALRRYHNAKLKLLRKPLVICSALSSDDWIRLAGHIDNGFFGSEKTFSVERKNGYYYLNTNKCDDVSMVRVYCQIGVEGIGKIERLGEDTDSWKEIHPDTYKSIEKFLNSKRSN